MLLIGLSVGICAATDDNGNKKKKATKTAKTEVVKTEKKENKSKIKPFSEVVTKDAKSKKGMFTIHKIGENWYFEIPDSLLGRDILTVGRIAKAPAGKSSQYAGDQVSRNVVRFEYGKEDKIFLRTVSYSERSTDTAGMYLSVLNSNLQAIAAAFDIKAFHKTDSTSKANVLIDVTSFINGDNTYLFFNKYYKESYNLSGLITDLSYIDTIKPFAENIEIRTVKTYSQKAAIPSRPAGDPITYELNCSMLLLPKEPMKPRYYDPRVGYFTVRYTDFDANPQGIENISMITRWRLEPKVEDIEKYKRGELVEPKKPIIYYIDPSTPKKWVPYLIQGVNDWQKAFEAAGFKNAILGMEAPNDSAWSLEDARHSAIVYKPSSIPNASGPHVNDPRSGEILESHINWYHNVMLLLRNWYFIQCSPLDIRAQKLEFDDELMGQLIRFVSSHEVGHTLGLRHNFGSSNTVPVEKLRDKEWVEANGHTPSIMDYARFNYVAQPEDNISEIGLFPRIGIYDDWAIQWGYQWLPQFDQAQDEATFLNLQIMNQLAKDSRYRFGTESDPDDPRNQNEDLGDNAMKAGEYGIKNLQRILPNLLAWTRQENKDYTQTASMYKELTGQFFRYMGHVAKNVGGIYETPKTVEESGVVYEFVSESVQKEAIQFLDKQLFKTPNWLINKELIYLSGIDPVEVIANIDRSIIYRLLNEQTFTKMLLDETLNGNTAYTVSELLSDLKKSIWSELNSGQKMDIYRRNLQKYYVYALAEMLNNDNQRKNMISVGSLSMMISNIKASDVSGIARAHLSQLQTELKRSSASSDLDRYHYQELIAQIEKLLKTDK